MAGLTRWIDWAEDTESDPDKHPRHQIEQHYHLQHKAVDGKQERPDQALLRQIAVGH